MLAGKAAMDGNCNFTATGTATGPYPGTFTATVSFATGFFHESFQIDSPAGTVTGTKVERNGFLFCPITALQVR